MFKINNETFRKHEITGLIDVFNMFKVNKGDIRTMSIAVI